MVLCARLCAEVHIEPVPRLGMGLGMVLCARLGVDVHFDPG